jgi:hypothetical protein
MVTYIAAMRPPKEPPSDVMADLERVGTAKPLGYLPKKTITKFCGQRIRDVRRRATLHGLQSVSYTPDQCDISSGAVYVWHEPTLAKLLTDNAAMLDELGWPTEPMAFVEKVATDQGEDPRLYELIGRAFDDFRFPFVRPDLTV